MRQNWQHRCQSGRTSTILAMTVSTLRAQNQRREGIQPKRSRCRGRETDCLTAVKDSNVYPTGIKVSDEELAALHLSSKSFHGEWSYTIKPQES